MGGSGEAPRRTGAGCGLWKLFTVCVYEREVMLRAEKGQPHQLEGDKKWEVPFSCVQKGRWSGDMKGERLEEETALD